MRLSTGIQCITTTICPKITTNITLNKPLINYFTVQFLISISIHSPQRFLYFPKVLPSCLPLTTILLVWQIIIELVEPAELPVNVY